MKTGAGSLVDRPCPICGSSDDSRVVADAKIDHARLDAFAFSSRKVPEYMHYRLVLCSACDCVYASPAPPPDVTTPAYQEAAFDSAVESGYAGKSYGRLLSTLINRLPDRSGALDIGAGDGAFLEQLLAQGFTNVVGVEPSRAPIAAAKDSVRRLIQHGNFDVRRFESGRYSLVTCFQTLEHLHDPSAVCRDAYELLKPGGAFFVICHNHRALSARILGKKSPIFDVEHLQLFSPGSLTTLLSRTGFERVVVDPIWNSYPIAYWMRLMPCPSTLKRAAIAAINATGIGRIPLAIPAGNMAAVGYKPRSSAEVEPENRGSSSSMVETRP